MFELPTRHGSDSGAPAWRTTWHPPADALAELVRRTGAPAAWVLAEAWGVLAARYGHDHVLTGASRRADLGVLLADPSITLDDLLRLPVAGAAARPYLPTVFVGRAADPGAAEDADLCLLVVPDGPVEVRAASGTYRRATAEALFTQMDVFLRAVAADPGQPVAGIPVLAEPDLELVLGDLGGRIEHYPPVPLHHLVSLQAWRTPDAVAIESADGSLTYRQLDRTTNAFAGRLRDAGASIGEPVAVYGERSLELFVALLGVLKAGAVILYLDPTLPAEWLARIVQQGGARTLTAADVAGPAAALGAVDVVPFGDALRHEQAAPIPVTVGPEDPAYLIFTSGSTGEPKGVLRPHRMHTSRIFLEQGRYRLSHTDRHLLKSPISFREFIWPLATGGTAVIAAPGGERDDQYLIRFIREKSISVVSFVPSMLRVLANQPDFGACDSLRHIFVGGEVLPPDLEREVRKFGYGLHNTYTLTEADYVAHRADPLAEYTDRSVVGRPLDMRVFLCDPFGALVPPGVPGEMYVGGPGLAAGYLGAPDVTAAKFLPNTFDDSCERVFRTGDIGRWRKDGQLEYLGRRDSQIKVRGNRIEPTELERVLREHPEVRDCAVAAWPDPDQGARLAAFIVPMDGRVPVEELRRYVGRRLPDYFVPAVIVGLDRLPQLISGKVDRQRLAPTVNGRPSLERAYSAPENDDERRVAAVWQRILGIHELGAEDTFTELGGDSLRLLVLRAALEQEFGRRFELPDLLERATVRAQAVLLNPASPVQPVAAFPVDRGAANLAERGRRARQSSAASDQGGSR